MSATGLPGAPRDPLSELLELASREGALEGASLVAFLEALGERSRLVLAERVERLEQRLRDAEAGRQAASQAHAALLAHHRDVVERVAAELEAIASLSPLQLRQARRRLRSLAELLRADTR
jgi:hypothetical protein